MKKSLCVIMTVLVLLPIILIPINAAGSDMSFSFDITSDGKNEKKVTTGDIITVVLMLTRTDSQEKYMMHAMQDELRYDNRFLELVDGSQMLHDGVVSTDIAMVDGHRELYMNYLSLSGGAEWPASVKVGSVQFKVIGESGVTKITNQDYLVSLPDGSGSYSCKASDLTLVISGECTVSFESNGGSKIPDVSAVIGEKIPLPEAPVREGYEFAGWFSDIHLTDEWDFENDTVESNMTLYAKWVIADSSDTTAPLTDTDEVDTEPEPIPDRGCDTTDMLLIILIILAIVICLLLLRKRSEKPQEKNENK